MLSLFKKKPAAERTLKVRVEEFWSWYTEIAPRFHRTIEAGKCADLGNEVISKIDELFPGSAWVFGPGEKKGDHSFTLSGEGVVHRQLITQYWLARAPTLPGWTFYAARQPGPIKGQIMHIGENKFDPMEFWIAPTLNVENEEIDIVAWHPLFKVLDDRQQKTVLYLFLDEVLGEYGTEMYLGVIETGETQLANSIPLAELLEFVKTTETQQGWKKYPPGKCFTGYSCKEPHQNFLRGDVIAGTTANFRLIREYLNSDGELDDPLKGTGADYLFVAFDASIFPEGQQVDARGKIEDALESALESAQSGRVLGGAMGTQKAYIDLMIFDGEASLKIIQQILKEQKMPPGTEIHFFAKEKRGHRVVL